MMSLTIYGMHNSKLTSVVINSEYKNIVLVCYLKKCNEFGVRYSY